MILVRSDFPHIYRPIQNLKYAEAVGVQIQIDHKRVTIIAAYIPPNKLISSDLTQIF